MTEAGLTRLWAGWRIPYLESGAVEPPAQPSPAGEVAEKPCPFCELLASGRPDDDTYIVHRGREVFSILNLYPYASGHILVMPYRHVAWPADLSAAEAGELWQEIMAAITTLSRVYGPEGMNLGANLGRAAGAGIPGHFHLHALPRWNGDTSFMTTVAETRVLPESLPVTHQRISMNWCSPAAPE